MESVRKKVSSEGFQQKHSMIAFRSSCVLYTENIKLTPNGEVATVIRVFHLQKHSTDSIKFDTWWVYTTRCRFKYKGRLKSSWTHLITPSCNFVGLPPLARDALLTTLNPLFENVLQAVDHFGISCLGALFSWLEKLRNRTGARYELNSVFHLEKVDRWNPIRTSAIHK
jgi:hypothetical protein